MPTGGDAESEGAPLDGRVRRGAANRQRIVDALYDLVGEGLVQPTAEQVARRAGVGERTVFRHFQDMDALYAEMSARLRREFLQVFEDPVLVGDLPARARELVARRVRIYEPTLPFARSGRVHRPRSKFLQEEHAKNRRGLREDVANWLAPEVDRDSDVIEIVDLLLSPEAYDRLRGDQRMGRERATRLLEAAVLAVVTES